MRTVVVIQARQGSARLPGKSMSAIAGKPMLAQVIDRAQRVRNISEVAVVTSVNERDRPIVELAGALGCACYQGDEHDVLSRFIALIDPLGLAMRDRVMRITGDCPLLCPDVCERVMVEADLTPWFDCWTNDVNVSGYPDGTDCELATVSALTMAHGAIQGSASKAAISRHDREHVVPWIRRNLAVRTVMCPSPDPSHRAAKWSVDTADDLELVRTIYGEMTGGGAYTLPDVTAAWRRAQQRGRV